MTLTLLILGSVLLLLLSFFSRSSDHWKSQRVPHEPWAIPIFGHALSLFTLQDNFGTLLEKLYRKMGQNSMYGCHVMHRPGLLLRDPELIKRVLQTDFSSFRNNLIDLNENLDPILTKNPFFAKNATWERSRALLTTNFSGRKLRSLLVVVDRACGKLKDYVDSKIINNNRSKDLELRFLFSRAVAETIANASFGLEGKSFEDELGEGAFVRIPEVVFNLDNWQALLQSVRYFLPRLADSIGVSVATKPVNAYIKHHLGNLIKSKVQGDHLQFSLKDVDKIDENFLMAQATALLFDGYEAIGSTLVFLFYRLSRNPKIQEKVRAEVDSTFEKFNHEFSYEALKGMTYLDQVINEVLRMNPLFGDITRLCNRETTLEGYDGLGCTLKPGDVVLISASGLHHDPEFWPDPERFDPDRFDSSAKFNRFTFMGFSNGARICPGRRLGLMVVKALAAVVLRNYSTVISDRMEEPLKLNRNTFASSVEGGVWVNFVPL